MSEHPISLHFLCVGVDPSFLTALLEKSDSLEISLDTCKTSEEARHKIEHATYDVIVLDLSITEKAAFELTHEIRTNISEKHVVAIISGSYEEKVHLNLLKDKGMFNYVMEKPITLKQIDGFIQFLHQHFAPPSATYPTTEKLEGLKQKYLATIPEKIDLITHLVTSAQETPDSPHLNELKDTLHKISGSAGSYGFKNISALCKELDSQISEHLATGSITDKSWLSSFTTFLSKIKEGFTAPAISNIPGNQKKRETHHIYVVDHDTNLLQTLEPAKSEFPITLSIESDPEKALEKLKQHNLNPDAIIAAQNFPESTITAFDLFKTQRMKFTEYPPLLALIMDQENIDVRIEAMNRGVNYIFRKPVYADVLLSTISEGFAESPISSFKVLVLDDDADFCNFVTIVLSEIGVPVRTISDSTQLFKALDQFEPQVLLLDLVLPKYDGLNMLKSIRQDIAYNNLIVVMVTSSEEPLTRISAYSAKADDILYKPLDAEMLQKRILNYAERHHPRFSSQNETVKSNLLSLKTLITKINTSLEKPGPASESLVIFEISNFTNWLMKHGREAVNNLLSYINKKIDVESGPSMHNFSYSLSKFAIVFDEDKILKLSKRKLSTSSQILRKTAQKKMSLSTALSSPFPKNSEQQSNFFTLLTHASTKQVRKINPPCGPIFLILLKRAFLQQKKLFSSTQIRSYSGSSKQLLRHIMSLYSHL